MKTSLYFVLFRTYRFDSLNVFRFVCFVILLFSLGIDTNVLSQENFDGTKKTTSERGLNSLPSSNGQFWMTYDISPYTNLYPTLPKPQQTIIRWILSDLNEDFWHSEPFGIFSATRDKLYVYHNQEVQNYMANIIDRFVDPARKNEMFTVRILVLQSPDWRTRTAAYMRPYPVSSKDVQGWIIDKTLSESFFADISRRSDFVELNAAKNNVPNGETFGWILPMPAKKYVRDIQIDPKATSGYISETSTVEEGYRIEITPLVSLDGQKLEFLFKCQSSVIEKMHSFSLKIPTQSSPRQQLTAEIPQIAHSNLTGKISFPKESVFLLNLGMIPMILTESTSSGFVGNFSKLISSQSVYYNVLIVISAQ
ncbi:MAG: hypothetical protein Q4C95_08820 [Planctomycetia bacterium]|nr:hypothetical protein [Planctomycetia bacterium]